jgi:hypothetical protein
MSKLISGINKLSDYLKFDQYRNLRIQITKILKENKTNFDYGYNYFYQSLEKINLSGLRNTQKRIDTLGLQNLVENKSVLDIGSNIGAISLQLNQKFIRFDNVEYNITLNKIGEIISKFLNFKNINFYSQNFLEIKLKKKYELILSLANHSTYDKGIVDTELYFKKIHNLLNYKGILVIESHHPKYEDLKNFKRTIIDNFNKNLKIIKKGKYQFNNFYDDGREFYILQK